jgi:hypothetical protein
VKKMLRKAKRKSPTGRDAERIMNNINRKFGFPEIGSYEDFEKYWNQYFEVSPEIVDNVAAKNQVFRRFVRERKGTPIQISQPGIPKVPRLRKPIFDLIGYQTVKGRRRQVFVREKYIRIRGKKILKYVDKKGRFARVPKPKEK